jgi:hypothetical protein
MVILAMMATTDPVTRKIFSAGLDLTKVRSAKLYVVEQKAETLGMTVVVESQDQAGADLGSFSVASWLFLVGKDPLESRGRCGGGTLFDVPSHFNGCKPLSTVHTFGEAYQKCQKLGGFRQEGRRAESCAIMSLRW